MKRKRESEKKVPLGSFVKELAEWTLFDLWSKLGVKFVMLISLSFSFSFSFVSHPMLVHQIVYHWNVSACKSTSMERRRVYAPQHQRVIPGLSIQRVEEKSDELIS
ncbi:hypothetical protein VNO80_02274 [Phaseolus coccineus]|uniref:Uncharacterized protein n=1 Tax=Phaseolus coccineus TaxID=3886 RepID=A0AAN9NQ34_PHACN